MDSPAMSIARRAGLSGPSSVALLRRVDTAALSEEDGVCALEMKVEPKNVPAAQTSTARATDTVRVVFMTSFFLIAVLLLPQPRGRDYSRSILGTGMPSKERFRHAQHGRASAMEVLEIVSFVRDSSRSRELSLLFRFLHSF